MNDRPPVEPGSDPHEPAAGTPPVPAQPAPVDREGAWTAPGTRAGSASVGAAQPRAVRVFRCSFQGELDFSCRDELATVARAFASSRCTSAEVDVSGVTFVDSSALAMLLGMRRTAQGRGGEVALVEPGRQLRRLLAVAGVSALFGVDEASTD